MSNLKKLIRSIKGLKQRGTKSTSLYLRLFGYIGSLLFAFLIGVLFILTASGVLSFEKEEAKTLIENEIIHETNDISEYVTEMANRSVQLSYGITALLGTFGDKVDGNSERIKYITPYLHSYIQSFKYSGAFVYLTENEDKASGIFLKSTDSDTSNMVTTKCYCLRGPADVARDNEIELLGQWKMDFTEEESDMFKEFMKTSEKNKALGAEKLYRLTERYTLEDHSEAGFLLMTPIFDNAGKVYGVCGYEIGSMQFKRRFSPDNSKYSHIFTALAMTESDSYKIGEGLMAGNSYLNNSLVGEDVVLEKNKDGFTSFTLKDGTVYEGRFNDITIYSKSSPYFKEKWSVAVLSLYDELGKTEILETLKIHLSLLVLLVVGIMFSFFLSKKYIEPIVTTFDNIVKTENIQDVEKTGYKEINDLLEYLQNQEDSTEDGSDEEDIAGAETDCTDNVDEDEYRLFLDRISTLSIAEKRVFDLYVKEYKAKEIAEELSLSINTIKYHNNNIYAKLEVDNKKDMMKFIRRMRKEKINAAP